ncbi:MAG: hypothetical protein OXC05_04995 [Halieaceae bacterium]|nr:hypothetical protein [Halieaceae bacterium]
MPYPVLTTNLLTASCVQWERDNPAMKYGDHVYSLKRYGPSHTEIRDRFAAYYQAFSSSF